MHDSETLPRTLSYPKADFDNSPLCPGKKPAPNIDLTLEINFYYIQSAESKDCSSTCIDMNNSPININFKSNVI